MAGWFDYVRMILGWKSSEPVEEVLARSGPMHVASWVCYEHGSVASLLHEHGVVAYAIHEHGTAEGDIYQ